MAKFAQTGDHPPFALRGDDGQPEWFCIVRGRTFGAWDNKGAALAGYQVEKRRADAREAKATEAAR